MPRRIGFLVFDDVEELDVIGPWEVFGMAMRLGADIETLMIAPAVAPVRARYGLQIMPDTSIVGAPTLDVLVVPGGLGARTFAREDSRILDFVQRARSSGWVVSVCTGALILAAAGLLHGRQATTHSSAYDLLRQTPHVEVVEHVRYIIEEPIATSAGVSAGIDLALALLERWYGTELRNRVAGRMEWPLS